MQISKGEEVPVNIVGGSTFGLFSKISAEQTWNMFISEGWIVNYAGFQKVLQDIQANGEGRGIFNSVRGNFMMVVISSGVYTITNNLTITQRGTINTASGDVFIDENLSSQICIVDGQDAYIYNWADQSFTLQTLMFVAQPISPSYVCYHNSFFLFGSSAFSINPQYWYAFQRDTDKTISFVTQLSIQTKPDSALAIERLPGHGNNVLVLGSTVAEVWTQVGGAENYRRIQSFNIDNGIVSTSTIASSDEWVCWLSQNENNSPAIMISDGSSSKKISTDGIDFRLSQIQFPAQSSAFFFRQDGHLFYQLTFYNKVDNISLIYDFTTQMFFNVSDENQGYHPARQLVFFNEKSYFISIKDGSLYAMDTNLFTYNYNIDPNVTGREIPRIRICKAIRMANSERFRVGQFTFWIEQGAITVPALAQSEVNMSLSKNGGQSFGNIISRPLNNTAQFRNQIRWWRIGQCNELIIQLRFIGFQKFICSGGTAEIF